MARRSKRSTKREPKATSRKSKKAAAEVEVVEEAEEGGGLDTGIAVITAVMLLVAILFVDAHLGQYGAGMFFK